MTAGRQQTEAQYRYRAGPRFVNQSKFPFLFCVCGPRVRPVDFSTVGRHTCMYCILTSCITDDKSSIITALLHALILARQLVFGPPLYEFTDQFSPDSATGSRCEAVGAESTPLDSATVCVFEITGAFDIPVTLTPTRSPRFVLFLSSMPLSTRR